MLYANLKKFDESNMECIKSQIFYISNIIFLIEKDLIN